MKLKNLLVIVMAMVLLVLSSCNKGMYANYANVINEAYKNGTPLTYADITERLGNPIINNATFEYSYGRSGEITWAKDCYSEEEYLKKCTDGKSVITITVTFSQDKAIKAVVKN